MISEALTREINEQIKFELYSAYMYLAMSADCSNRNLTGFAHWLSQQAEEEVAHTVNDRVPIEHLVTCAAFYAAFPEVYCKKHPKPNAS